jgi:hypothetical protein
LKKDKRNLKKWKDGNLIGDPDDEDLEEGNLDDTYNLNYYANDSLNNISMKDAMKSKYFFLLNLNLKFKLK